MPLVEPKDWVPGTVLLLSLVLLIGAPVTIGVSGTELVVWWEEEETGGCHQGEHGGQRRGGADTCRGSRQLGATRGAAGAIDDETIDQEFFG